MISEKRKNHFYVKLEENETESFDFSSQSLFVSKDLIIDLLSFEVIETSFLSLLKQINQVVIANGFSMVIVLNEIPFFSNFEFLNIVPTLIEAEDYIQMEQIQRDLGS